MHRQDRVSFLLPETASSVPAGPSASPQTRCFCTGGWSVYMDAELLLSILKKEIERSTGCTDPGCVCLTVARAAAELESVESVQVTVSDNIFKNGISVGVPGTGAIGLDIAAAMGVLLAQHWQEGLAILDHATPDVVARATCMLQEGRIKLHHACTPHPLYVRAEASNTQHTAYAVLMHDYANITEVGRDGAPLFSHASTSCSDEAEDKLAQYPVREVMETAQGLSFEQASFLLDFARVNKAAAQSGLADKTMRLGPLLAEINGTGGEPSPEQQVQLMTAAAGEARMRGLVVPIMAIAGSGNHGITNFLGVLALAESLEADPLQTARALAISSAITIYSKAYIKRMTAFCGCSVAAATGVAAAAVWLMGGNYPQAELAMHSVIGTLGGLFCDGAKESCAYKLSTAATMAVQFARLALKGCGIPVSTGIIGRNIEETFYNLGQLNNPGMVAADKLIVDIIDQRRSRQNA